MAARAGTPGAPARTNPAGGIPPESRRNSAPQRLACAGVEPRPGNAEGPSPEQRREAAERIEAARAESERLAASLARLWDGVVEASAQSNIDDEHDPEGATVAYERAQLRDAIEQTRAGLADLERAAERLNAGEYWICELCAGPIPVERLAARPTARRCIDCAGKPG